MIVTRSCNFLKPVLTINLWNEILCSLRNLRKKEFKREVRRLLLDILVQENDYIETPILL